MKISMCLGIRPDWIVNSLLINKLSKWLEEDFILIHSGQHYSYNMDKIFFQELRIREPDYFLEIGSGSQGYQTAETIKRSEEIFFKTRPDIVLGFSDGNPVLSCIGATKNQIKVAHMEAGMRSYDWRMPEEKNRRMINAIADYFFVPTTIAYNNLVNEGIYKPKIFIVGKQVIDILEEYKYQIDNSEVLDKFNLNRNNYFLVTAHRPENVENLYVLKNIVKALNIIYSKYELPIIFPAHPRTIKSLNKLKITGYSLNKNISLIEYLGFFDFTKLEKNALCLITDSGTVEEDGCWFKVPCITFRISTERPETEHCGSNLVVGTNTDNIVNGVFHMINKPRNWNCPYYTGATEKIVSILKTKEEEILSKKIWW